MIAITDKTKCSGCGACHNICPTTAIAMPFDEEGFTYPSVNKDICINCAKCVKVCPLIHNTPKNKVKLVFAAVNKDCAALANSSSGGMFSLLASFVLGQGGVVFGAAFDDNFNVFHTFAEREEDLNKLRRSKYVQSDIGFSLRRAKEFLEEGRAVLFTGAPCQAAGLKNYLGKDYRNLYVADIICHSVPSPQIWQRYLNETFDLKDIKKIEFREKSNGWDKSRPVAVTNNGIVSTEIFSNGFFSGLYARPSCHKCGFKGEIKYSDFTMADFWGVKKVQPAIYNKNGVSLLMLNSQKAQALFNTLKEQISYQEVSLAQATKYNPYFYKSTKPNIKRAQFFASLQDGLLAKNIRAFTKQNMFMKALKILKRKILG